MFSTLQATVNIYFQISYNSESDYYNMTVSDDNYSQLYLTLQVSSLQDLDFNARHWLSITNSVGTQEFEMVFKNDR